MKINKLVITKKVNKKNKLKIRPEEWIVGKDTGASSKTIWAVMMGTRYIHASTPSDPEDFGRCFRLLETFPEWKARLNEVSKQHPDWKKLIANWSQMEEVYIREGSKKHSNHDHPELYHLMSYLLGRKLYGVPKKLGSKEIEYKKVFSKIPQW